MPRSLWMGIRPKVKLKLHFLLNPIMLAPPSLISQPHAFSPLEHLHQFHRGVQSHPAPGKKKQSSKAKSLGLVVVRLFIQRPLVRSQTRSSSEDSSLGISVLGRWGGIGMFRDFWSFHHQGGCDAVHGHLGFQLMALRSWSHLSHLSHLALLHVTRRSPQVATSLCLLAVSSFPLGAS